MTIYQCPESWKILECQHRKAVPALQVTQLKQPLCLHRLACTLMHPEDRRMIQNDFRLVCLKAWQQVCETKGSQQILFAIGGVPPFQSAFCSVLLEFFVCSQDGSFVSFYQLGCYCADCQRLGHVARLRHLCLNHQVSLKSRPLGGMSKPPSFGFETFHSFKSLKW